MAQPIAVEVQEGVLVVRVPYRAQWPTAARGAGGRWDTERRCWLFDGAQLGPVRKALARVYGVAVVVAGDAGSQMQLAATLADLRERRNELIAELGSIGAEIERVEAQLRAGP